MFKLHHLPAVAQSGVKINIQVLSDSSLRQYKRSLSFLHFIKKFEARRAERYIRLLSVFHSQKLIRTHTRRSVFIHYASGALPRLKATLQHILAQPGERGEFPPSPKKRSCAELPRGARGEDGYIYISKAPLLLCVANVFASKLSQIDGSSRRQPW
jgi:hypothetical protein